MIIYIYNYTFTHTYYIYVILYVYIINIYIFIFVIFHSYYLALPGRLCSDLAGSVPDARLGRGIAKSQKWRAQHQQHCFHDKTSEII